MTEVQPSSAGPLPPGEVPEAFVNQVRDVLAHLYDLGYLQMHQLTPVQVDAGGGQQFKRELMEMIETLNPGAAFYFRAPQARPYNMLLLHYVERVTIQRAATELGISERQAYRELREGELRIARLLWAKREAGADGEDALPNAAADPHVPETNGLRELMEGAAATVHRLASQTGVQLHIDLEISPVIRPENQAVVRQILVSILSRIIQAAAGDVWIHSYLSDETNFLVYTFVPKMAAIENQMPIDSIVQQLLQQVGWAYHHKPLAGGKQCIEIRLASGEPVVLHIDDDEGFTGLLKRYLNGRPVRLINARSGLEGIEAARATRPAMIILDVMMPGLDGWETLQRLQTDPETMGIPLVICSVFNDPELARSLGARKVLPKPVSQEGFLATLGEMGVRIV